MRHFDLILLVRTINTVVNELYNHSARGGMFRVRLPTRHRHERVKVFHEPGRHIGADEDHHGSSGGSLFPEIAPRCRRRSTFQKLRNLVDTLAQPALNSVVSIGSCVMGVWVWVRVWVWGLLAVVP